MSDTAAIEQDIRAARARLEGTVNELAYRVQPQVIAQRQVQSLKLKVDEVTRTPEGDLRVERVVAVAAAVVALVVVARLLRRRR
ncbi:hypothetical protein N865_12210 [Intrasporangium oryzae NRRL B-24470]|uniref:DUF3618 domain-containing protein n=1 Tax=Intrasporangium oryzae NRRL B-24470 TaxID=1386089 RepID=W9G6Q2_9MICO|nr:DUF3618 domain-containing protein [Intrasporangium oryzae]EWT00982.1 hypothetical protein N865_12210 [Intrasporangium oryzae NRRL B-24470]